MPGKNMLNSEKWISVLSNLYGDNKSEILYQKNRYARIERTFKEQFNCNPVGLFSTPGRTEIGGNHTDHNHGCVLAAAVNLDSIATAKPNSDKIVTIHSEGFDQPIIVNLNDMEVNPKERGKTTALIRGIASFFNKHGYNTKGFNATITSDVHIGSGLSSSASIEVLIGTIFSYFFNKGEVPLETLAMAGQFSENVYFGKPCGLMDQLSCTLGGIVSIDFSDQSSPSVQGIDFDFANHGYHLLVVDTGSNHEDLTDDYAAIPNEMLKVAEEFGKKVLREVPRDQLIKSLSKVRGKVGDRAVLRALHFMEENERVGAQVKALEKGNLDMFLRLVGESGNSSQRWLQNIYSPKNVHEQGVTLALNLTEYYLCQNNAGVCRVHGGGFAGCIQVFLKNDFIEGYVKFISRVFGVNAVKVLDIRNIGAIQIC